jgi:hypothetical protein
VKASQVVAILLMIILIALTSGFAVSGLRQDIRILHERVELLERRPYMKPLPHVEPKYEDEA